MTHEQKPESAEFRTREEIETEMRRLLTHGVRGPNAAMQVVHRIFDEVRAFGASEEQSASRAEQRRKDTERAEPIMWERMSPTAGWTYCKDPEYWRSSGYAVRPLYTDSPNVAALQARVKELEAQLGATQYGAVRQVIHSPLRHFKPEDRA